MSVQIRLIRLADGRTSPLDGQYVVSCDVNDTKGNLGFGNVTATTDPTKAKQFETTIDAWDYWSRTSTTTPRRPDGKPNRPLTAFTIELKQ